MPDGACAELWTASTTAYFRGHLQEARLHAGRIMKTGPVEEFWPKAVIMEACCLRDLGLLDEGMAFLDQHLPQLPDAIREHALSIKLSLMVRQGRWSQAINMGENLLSLYGRSSRFAADNHRCMATCARTMGEYDLAVQHLDAALVLFADRGQTDNVTDCLVDKMQVLRQSGRVRESLLIWRTVSQNLSQSLNYRHRSFALSEYARAALDVGDVDQAACTSLQIISEVPATDVYQRPALAEAMYVLGTVAAASGRDSEARRHMAGSLRLLDGIPSCQRLRSEVLGAYRSLSV